MLEGFFYQCAGESGVKQSPTDKQVDKQTKYISSIVNQDKIGKMAGPSSKEFHEDGY